MINQLYSYRNGVRGEFFLSVAAELERLQKLSESRLENIKAMSGYLDDVAEVLGVPKPGTPIEGIGACWKVMDAIQTLGYRSALAEHLATAALTALSGIVCTPVEGYLKEPLRLKDDILQLIKLEESATKRAISAEAGWKEALATIEQMKESV